MMSNTSTATATVIAMGITAIAITAIAITTTTSKYYVSFFNFIFKKKTSQVDKNLFLFFFLLLLRLLFLLSSSSGGGGGGFLRGEGGKDADDKAVDLEKREPQLGWGVLVDDDLERGIHNPEAPTSY